MKLKPNISRLKRFTLWLRREEEYEKETFVEGIANVDSLAGAIAHGLGGLVTLAVRTLYRGATWPFRKTAQLIKRATAALVAGIKQAIHEFAVVVGEIVHDVRHLIATTIRRLLAPFATLGRIMTAPIRKRMARQAKAQVLSDVTMTSDRHSHWELLVLTAAAVVAGGGLLAATGRADGLLTLAGRAGSKAAQIDPARLAAWLANASPTALALTAAVFLIGALAVWFWIRMTLDAWRRDYPSHLEQTRWRTVTALLFVPGALAYFIKVYNRWGIRQFVGYHISAVLMVGTAILVVTSTYGTLWYFNKQADAAVTPPSAAVPNLELDQQTRQDILNRPQYGAPLSASSTGRTDPFAPIPGQGEAAPATNPSPSPSPAASPQP